MSLPLALASPSRYCSPVLYATINTTKNTHLRTLTMPEKKRHFPPVGVSTELRSQAGPRVGEAVTVLRTSGADCWNCGRPVRQSHPANLVMEVTAVGTRLGFVHASCGPSQVRDSRSSRKAAIRAAETLKDAGTDMNAFLAFRASPYPQAMVVISSPSPLTYVDPESDESKAELMQHAVGHGDAASRPSGGGHWPSGGTKLDCFLLTAHRIR